MKEEIWEISLAVLSSLGGGALILFAFSTWLGKVWASRILEKDRLKYQNEMELIKSDITKKIHEHNVAVSRIDSHRAETIQKLYAQLVECFNISIEIRAPAKSDEPDVMIPFYTEHSLKLRKATEDFEILVMHSAISISEETYNNVAKCGILLSSLSIDFQGTISNYSSTNDPDQILAAIKDQANTMNEKIASDFNPAKAALLQDFRNILDPRL